MKLPFLRSVYFTVGLDGHEGEDIVDLPDDSTRSSFKKETKDSWQMNLEDHAVIDQRIAPEIRFARYVHLYVM